MTCAACGRELPPAFPGAVLMCVCGASTSYERPSALPASSPYRAAEPRSREEVDTPCPYCGHGCPPLVRICPHCDVRLENVRCVACYSLQPPGSFACGRCGTSLELEPLLDPTDAPCPRCRLPLEAGADPLLQPDDRVRECPRCGGMFVPREALAEILARAESSGVMTESRARRAAIAENVTYLPCPLCHTSMNRVNFGKVSGVIVDVCRKHGTWFDGGELTRVITFVANGGRARTKARDARDEQAQRARDKEAHASFVLTTTRIHAEETVDEWRRVLEALLFF